MRRGATALSFGALTIAWQQAGHAQAPPPAQRAHIYSPYEQETIDDVLRSLGAKVEPSPEGKVVERIDVVPIDVFEKRDPLPRWLNVFHATSRTAVIRREVLLHEGDHYKQVLADDTIRNLRRLPQLSVVLVVTAQGTAADHVRLIVITKDVWSIRLNWDVVLTSSGAGSGLIPLGLQIEQLDLQPAEWNVAGTHHTASGLFVLQPSAYTLGLGYEIPRIDRSRVAADAAANIVINRASGSPEGSAGSLIAGQPIYSGLTQWAWDGDTEWTDTIVRNYQNGQPTSFVDTMTGQSVPFQYRDREYVAAYHVTRSFGWDVKHDLRLGVAMSQARFSTNFSGVDPRTVADFESNNVPVSNTRVGPTIQYHSYTKRYLRVVDIESLALQEDVGLGHDVVVRFQPSLKALGSSLDLFATYAAAQYTVPLRDGFFRVAFAADTEPGSDKIVNASISPFAHLVTPTVADLGRIVLDGTMLYRWRDGFNITGACPGQSVWGPFDPCAVFLGGTDRLRGFPTNYFSGWKDFVSYNVEVRSRPVEILTCQLAGVAFYDAGSAFSDIGQIRTFQSVGFGVRALFPWLDREVFSADVGFPLERPIDQNGAPIPGFGFLVSFGQAFGVPSVATPSILPTGQSAW
jgi:hypothetical protein